ncbi:hypothetical protein VIGAN_04415700 [Vigna angularis var. angularis]|uniref:Secreted protein n=1 Tax=Vigna angularis var. angularis TaxID=157739 RepID=A0A0S3S104_PHAAN|nr:hypothetical protein VIGAN_04415700 [Vigna angularis var. angularis]
MIPIKTSLCLILMLTVLEHDIFRHHLFPTKRTRGPILLQPLVQTIPVKHVTALQLPHLLPFLQFAQAYPTLCSTTLFRLRQPLRVANRGVLLLDEFQVLLGADWAWR